MRPQAAGPLVEAAIPRIVVSEPPIAWAIAPIPGRDGKPGIRVATSRDLVFHPGPRNWRAEVILGLDLGRDLLAQHHGLRRCLDRDLEFWLFVFFNAERVAGN